uniref:Uncharacterized protein n=1 Tax=Sciurus vulgaris TaxID=55149 RepID=A0A8D2DP82_SCIVU
KLPSQKIPNLRTFKQRTLSHFEELKLLTGDRQSRKQILSLLDKTKLLVPQELTMTQFLSSIHCMILRATETFSLLMNNKSLVSMNVTMAEIYRDWVDEDSFIYVTYASQKAFGSLGLADPSKGSSLGDRSSILTSLCQEKPVF